MFSVLEEGMKRQRVGDLQLTSPKLPVLLASDPRPSAPSPSLFPPLSEQSLDRLTLSYLPLSCASSSSSSLFTSLRPTTLTLHILLETSTGSPPIYLTSKQPHGTNGILVSRSHVFESQSQSFHHVQLFVTPWTVAHQAPLSMEFFRQEY